MQLCYHFSLFAECPACTVLNAASASICDCCSNVLPSGRRASDSLLQSATSSRPVRAPIQSALLDASTIQDIISTVVAAVSAAMPLVPKETVKQIRVESLRAAKDISVAASAARRSIQDAVKDGLSQLDTQISEHNAQTKRLLSAKQLAADRDWLVVSGSGCYFCSICTKHCNLFTNAKQLQSRWVAGNGGVDPAQHRWGKPFPAQVHRHGESEMHQLAVDFDKARASMPLVASFSQQALHAENVTVTLLRTAIDGVVNYRAFNDFENLVYLQHLNGLDVGDWQHGRQAAAAMLGCAEAEWRQQMKLYLSTPLQSTGRVPYLGIAADKVSDNYNGSWQPICGRCNHKGKPVSFLLELYKMTKDCTGNSCWVGIKHGEEAAGVKPWQSISFAFDGEAAYQGELSGVKSAIKKERPLADVVHDYPHAGELLKEDMQKQCPYTVEVQDMLRQIYTLLSRSPKNYRCVQELCKSLDLDWKQLHYVFEVRMVESETVALKNFLADLPAIVEFLKANLEEAEVSGKQDISHAKQRNWLGKLQQFKFVAYGLLMLDQDNILRIFSQATQSDQAYALDVPGYKEKLVADLKLCESGSYGPEMKRNIEQLKQGSYAGIRLHGTPGKEEAIVSNEEWEEGDALEVEAILGKRPRGRGFQFLVKWLNWDNSETDFTWEARTSCSKCPEMIAGYEALPVTELHEHPDGGMVVRDIPRYLSRLQSGRSRETRMAARRPEDEPAVDICAENVERRIRQYQREMVAVLLQNCERRLSIPPVVYKFRDCFDFRRMVTQCVPKAGEDDPILSWGDASLRYIVEHKLPHLDADLVFAQAAAVRVYVLEHRDQYMVDVVDENKTVVGKKLDLAAVYENLFTENVLEPALPPRSYLTVLDYSIAYRFTQCDTERLGRVMNLTKTAARSTLGDVNFPASVYVTYNSPPIGEINFQRLVKRFQQKHRLAVMADGGTRVKQVINRHSEMHKNTFLS